MDRREFLRTLARFSVFSAIGLGVGFITSKGLSGSLPEQDCINNYICRSCGLVPECGLPQALSYKQAQKRINT